MACGPQVEQPSKLAALMGTIPILQLTPCPRMIDTSTTEFRAWFGESKIVGKEGEPLLVFHGSPRRNIHDFDRKGSIGTFFTHNPILAASYTGKNGVVYPAYLSIQNPLVWNMAETEAFQDWLLRRLLDGEETPWEVIEDFNTYIKTHDVDYRYGEEGLSDAIDELFKLPPGQVDYSELDPLAGYTRMYARERGHDGMIRPYNFGEGCQADFVEYIPFEPEQIRVAVAN